MPLILSLGDTIRGASASAVAVAVVAILAAAAPAAADSTPLNVSVASKPKKVLASVTHTPDILSFSVELNGREITPLFKASSRGVPNVTLGGSDGLRFGARNVLRAEVTMPGQNAPVIVTRRFRVKPRRVIASAGPDRTVRAGDAVRLDGTRSLARKTRKGKRRSPKMRWELVRAPKGSRAALSASRGKRPSLRTDMPGTYIVRAAAQLGPKSARVDLARVLAVDDSYSGNGLIVSSINSSGGPDGPADGIRVYGGSGATTYSGGGGLVFVAFDDTTLEPLGTVTAAASATDCGPTDTAVRAIVDNAQETLGHDVLWLVQGSVPVSGDLDVMTCYAKLVTQTTGAATNAFTGLETGFPIAAAGTETFSGGACPAASSSAGFSAGSVQSEWAGCPGYMVLNDIHQSSRLTGTLIRNTDDRFVFMPNYQVTADVPLMHFDTRDPSSTQDQNVMVVGDETLASADIGSATGGFQVVTIDGRSGNPVTVANSPNQTFVTNGSGNDIGGIQDMQDMLEGIRTATETEDRYLIPENSVVILIQGIGTPAAVNLGTATRKHQPLDANDALRNEWEELGNLVAVFGGTRNGINANPSLWASGAAGGAPGYALATSSLFNANEATSFQPTTEIPAAEAVGSTPPLHDLDSGSDIPIPVRVTGTLRRNTYWQLEPSGSQGDPATEVNAPTLGDIAQSVDKDGNPQLLPTPFPHQKDPEWIAAAQYAASHTSPALVYSPTNPGDSCYRPPDGLSDIRSNYCGDEGVLRSFLENFRTLSYPTGQPFSQKTWELMKAQIAYEIPIVLAVDSRISSQQSLFQGQTPMVDAQTIAGEINKKIAADLQAQSKTASFVFALLSDAFLSALPFIPDEETIFKLGIEELGNGLTAGSSILGYGTGGSNAPPFGQLTVAQTTALIDTGLQNTAGALDRIRTLINSDYGKLQQFDRFLSRQNASLAAAAPDIAAALNVSVAQQAFSVLLSAKYQPVGYPCGDVGRHLNRFGFFYGCPYTMTSPQERENTFPHGCLNFASIADAVSPESLFNDDYVGVVPNDSFEFQRAYMLVLGGNRTYASNLTIADLIPKGVIGSGFESVQVRNGTPVPLPAGVVPQLGLDHDQWFNQSFGGLRANFGGMSDQVAGCVG